MVNNFLKEMRLTNSSFMDKEPNEVKAPFL